MKPAAISAQQPCPCGTHKTFSECCGAYIVNHQRPPTPEALMRSRYTAYKLLDIDYIARTMKPPAATDFDVIEARAWAEKITWTKLDVLKTSQDATTGMVEFRATYQVPGKKCVLHEISEFRCDEGQWYYVDGHQLDTQAAPHKASKIGRNDPCPCGSQKKYKKCCGNQQGTSE